MATTTYDFTGRERLATNLQITLDSDTYRAEIRWNLAAQRWYLSLFNASDGRVLTVPVVRSGASGGINLVAGYFANASIVWRADISKLEITG